MTLPSPFVPQINRQELVVRLRQQFQINWLGHHGIPHWARVRVNGLMLAKELGTNSHVAELFAFFHDARRFNEHEDKGHGERGAALAWQLRGQVFQATGEEMDLLEYACIHHSDGRRDNIDPTVMVCWDSDRLDLGRVGITPNPKYLCTDLAKKPNVIAQAQLRALVWRENFESQQDRMAATY